MIAPRLFDAPSWAAAGTVYRGDPILYICTGIDEMHVSTAAQKYNVPRAITISFGSMVPH